MPAIESFLEAVQSAAMMFDVHGIPAMMLSYDTESDTFEVWNFLDPAECNDFFIRQTRVPLSKITPADLNPEPETAALKVFAVQLAAIAHRCAHRWHTAALNDLDGIKL